MEAERIEFWDSIQELAKDTNIDITQYQKDPEKSSQREYSKRKIQSTQQTRPVMVSVSFFHEALHKSTL